MATSYMRVTCQYVYFVIAGYTPNGPIELCTVGEATLLRKSAADALWACQQAAEKAATDAMDAKLMERKAAGLPSTVYNENWLRSFTWYDTQAPSKVHTGTEFKNRNPWRASLKGTTNKYWGLSKGARQQRMREDAAWEAQKALWAEEDAAYNTVTGVMESLARLTALDAKADFGVDYLQEEVMA